MLRPLLVLLATSTAAFAQEAEPPPAAAPAEAAPAEAPPAEAPPAEAPPAEAPPEEPSSTAPTAPEAMPAAATPTEAAPAAAPTPPAPTTTTTPTGVTQTPERRIGDPVPLTRREPTLDALQFMVGLRYGLVGTGPTRFVDDIRFGITDTIELRTALLPYPSSLMARVRFGSQQSDVGAFIVDAGLAHWDAGLRVVPDTGESEVGMRLHFEAVAGYARVLGDRVALRAMAHYRYRLSLLDNDDQHAVAAEGHVTYDLLDALAVSAGLGIASTLGTPVRELSVNFVETDQPGMSHLLARDDGHSQSVTIPLTMTYGRVESFDVDLFCTPRVWPAAGILFGAGVRLRLDPFKS